MMYIAKKSVVCGITTVKALNRLAGIILGTVLAVSSTFADVTLEVVHAWGGHKRFHVPIAKAFMQRNPGITIKYRTPMKSYSDGHQTILRQALTDNLPDIWYSPYNALEELVVVLSARGQIKNLSDMLNSEARQWIQENYAPHVLALGQIDGEQWAMPFNASTPIVYYNADLVGKAGQDPDRFPDNWDEILSLGRKISAIGSDIDGLTYSVSEWSDDWLWQALIYSHGGDLMNAEKTKTTFDSDAGRKAIRLARRLVVETDMPFLTEDQSIQQFAAGKIGVFFGSAAEVRAMNKLTGDKFRWKTAPYPISDKLGGGLPVGGNAAVILSRNKKKQEAAWEFIKFATGPEAQKIAVLGSGYMATNLMAENDEYLGQHYRQNPEWATSMKQWPVARTWFGYPGHKGVKIWRRQKDILAAIMRGKTGVEEGLRELVDVTERLVVQ